MKPVLGWLALALALAPVLANGRSAFALERQHHLGVGGGVSVLSIDDKSTTSVGAGGAIHYAYGLSDAFQFMAEASSSLVALHETLEKNTPHTRPAGVDTFAVGAGYVLDVLRWVPYVGVLGSAALLSRGTLDKPLFVGGLQLAAGLDYMLTPHIGIGFAFRQHVLLTDMNTYPSYTNFFLRAEWVWGN